jgi:uncharacterized membrane protein
MTTVELNSEQTHSASRTLWFVNIIIAGLGLLDALYLTFIKLSSSTAAFCKPGGGCDVVNSSPYSEFFGIPIAVMGAAAYIALLALLLFAKGTVLLLQLGVSLVGVLYSAYLTYLELAVIHAICPYCVGSAIAMTMFFLITVYRLVKYEPSEENLEALGG